MQVRAHKRRAPLSEPPLQTHYHQGAGCQTHPRTPPAPLLGQGYLQGSSSCSGRRRQDTFLRAKHSLSKIILPPHPPGPQMYPRHHLRHHSLPAATSFLLEKPNSSKTPLHVRAADLSVPHAGWLWQASTRSRGCYCVFSQGFLTAKTSKRSQICGKTQNTCCSYCSNVRCALN